jgi:hypothetical protein
MVSLNLEAQYKVLEEIPYSGGCYIVIELNGKVYSVNVPSYLAFSVGDITIKDITEKLGRK